MRCKPDMQTLPLLFRFNLRTEKERHSHGSGASETDVSRFSLGIQLLGVRRRRYTALSAY